MGNFVFNIIGQDVSDLGEKSPPINKSSGKLARYILPETASQVGRTWLLAVFSAGPDQAPGDKALMQSFLPDAPQEAPSSLMAFDMLRCVQGLIRHRLTRRSWATLYPMRCSRRCLSGRSCPCRRVLAVAARQAVDSMIIQPLNTSRGSASAALHHLQEVTSSHKVWLPRHSSSESCSARHRFTCINHRSSGRIELFFPGPLLQLMMAPGRHAHMLRKVWRRHACILADARGRSGRDKTCPGCAMGVRDQFGVWGTNGAGAAGAPPFRSFHAQAPSRVRDHHLTPVLA